MFTLQFFDTFFDYRKIWFHVNVVNNSFNILCIFTTIYFGRQPIFFLSYSLKPKSIRFQKSSKDQTFR